MLSSRYEALKKFRKHLKWLERLLLSSLPRAVFHCSRVFYALQPTRVFLPTNTRWHTNRLSLLVVSTQKKTVAIQSRCKKKKIYQNKAIEEPQDERLSPHDSALQWRSTMQNLDTVIRIRDAQAEVFYWRKLYAVKKKIKKQSGRWYHSVCKKDVLFEGNTSFFVLFDSAN